MTCIIEPVTQRLCLRQWCAADREPFAAMNADPEVMACMPSLLSREQSDALQARLRALIAERGWGFWAVEIREAQTFIGFVGLNLPGPELPCSPCVEIGWRLARPYWGKGYAFEAATAVLQVAFERLTMPEIVAFTALTNRRSLALMHKLGMEDAGVFQHPRLAAESPLRPHRLFRLQRTTFERR